MHYVLNLVYNLKNVFRMCNFTLLHSCINKQIFSILNCVCSVITFHYKDVLIVMSKFSALEKINV